MKVLVTGHLGYLGKVLTRKLDEQGIEWAGLDIGLFESGPLDLRQDVRRASFQGFDAVVHLAAIVGEPACMYKTEMAKKINIEGTVNLVDQAAQQRTPLIFASTCSVYGAADYVLFEDSALNPLGPYARTRLEAEEYATGNDAIALRFGTLFGWSPRMRFDLVINAWAAKAARLEAITVEGGKQWRPFCQVENAAEAIVCLLRESKRDAGVYGKVYNCAAVNVQIGELANQFRIQSGCKVDVNGKIQDMRNYRVNNERLIALGWEPRTDLQAMIGELICQIKEAELDPNEAKYSDLETLKKRFPVRSV